MRSTTIALLLAASAAAIPGTASAAKSGFDNPPRPPATQFTGHVDNPWFPLPRGTTRIYRGLGDGERTRSTFKITNKTKRIQGVDCVVVLDRAYIAGKLRETTFDWFAQDRAGNVWYFGEDTKELDEKGNVETTAGSWEAGVDGAEAGIVMPARPRVGDTYRQEFYAGEAEDEFRITDLNAKVRTPFRTFKHALKTRDTTPLDPELLENKFYARGVGVVREVDLTGPDEYAELVAIRR
jgi:hypothetical protein